MIQKGERGKVRVRDQSSFPVFLEAGILEIWRVTLMPELSHFVHESPEASEPTEVPQAALPAAEEDGIEVLPDEVTIEVPPARPSGTLQVKLVWTGRSTPIPADDRFVE
jgi:hypothetical protein